MSIVASLHKLTYEDLRHMPEDGKRHEIIEGEHHVTPSPASKHQFIVANLLTIVGPFVREHELGRLAGAPLDVVLTDTDVVQPDLLLVAQAHLDRITEENLQGSPDLAVEILSESTRRRDEVTKRHLYERHGVPEYWIVDPVVETLKVFRPGEDGRYQRAAELSLETADVLTSPLFPGLEIPLAELFE
jgi:Uma2 family endonuclease